MFLIAVLACLPSLSAVARAQDADPRRDYKLLRDDENWAWLRTPSATRDFWDRVKYMRLIRRRDDLFLTLGGETRQWVEGYQNELWGSTGYVDNAYWLQRYMLHADLRLTRFVRVFAQLKSGLEVGRLGGPRPIDKDILDANQIYLDLDVLPAPTLDDDARMLVRVGRQEMSYGSGRLIDVREGPNVRVGYDGVRVVARPRFLARPSFLRIDAWLVRPDLTNPGVFDDGWDKSQLFWGGWATLDLPRVLVDVYYLGLDRDHGLYEKGSGHELRHTVGSRVMLRLVRSLVHIEVEGAYQFGTFLQGTISAWTLAASGVFRGTWLPLRPELTVGVGITSGDRDARSSTLGTFSPLFPRGQYFGLIGANGPSNNIAPHLALALLLPHAVSLSCELWGFWRESLSDGIYNVPGYLLRPGAGNSARYLGAQIEPFLSWAMTRHLSLNATFAYFWAGDFFVQSKPGHDITYGATWATYKF